eukprot:scaffold2248_cov261-Pinguiococcus_pyrenoidosus.AAC.5
MVPQLALLSTTQSSFTCSWSFPLDSKTQAKYPPTSFSLARWIPRLPWPVFHAERARRRESVLPHSSTVSTPQSLTLRGCRAQSAPGLGQHWMNPVSALSACSSACSTHCDSVQHQSLRAKNGSDRSDGGCHAHEGLHNYSHAQIGRQKSRDDTYDDHDRRKVNRNYDPLALRKLLVHAACLQRQRAHGHDEEKLGRPQQEEEAAPIATHSLRDPHRQAAFSFFRLVARGQGIKNRHQPQQEAIAEHEASDDVKHARYGHGHSFQLSVVKDAPDAIDL